MDLLIGIVGTVVGIGVLLLHCIAPGKLGKLAAFQEHYGEVAGKIMHIIFYGIIPLGVGSWCLYKMIMSRIL